MLLLFILTVHLLLLYRDYLESWWGIYKKFKLILVILKVPPQRIPGSSTRDLLKNVDSWAAPLICRARDCGDGSQHTCSNKHCRWCLAEAWDRKMAGGHLCAGIYLLHTGVNVQLEFEIKALVACTSTLVSPSDVLWQNSLFHVTPCCSLWILSMAITFLVKFYKGFNHVLTCT